MQDLMKVAIRNVSRNKRRTVITILTVFLGVVVSIATRGLLDGLQGEIRSNLTRKMHGDLQVHKKGYQDSLESSPFKLLLPEKINEIDLPQSPRLRIMVLLNHQKSQTTTPVMVTGIDSALESIVCPRLASSVQIGQMLNSSLEVAPTSIVDNDLEEASPLGNENTNNTHTSSKAEGYQQIMLTPSLQRGLGAEIGDELVVLLSDKDKMQQAMVVRLVGIVDVATPGAAARMAWMDLKSLQKVLNIQGQATEIAMRLPEEAHLEDAHKKYSGFANQELVLETWKELSGFLRDAMALQDIIFSSVVAIMFAIVISAIINTSLMTVMERTREIGTLMALGYRRKHILFLFLTESAVIGGAGGILGSVLGSALLMLLNIKGLIVTLPGQNIPTKLYPSVSFFFIGLVFCLAVCAALIAGVVPALRASHMKPVDALAST